MAENEDVMPNPSQADVMNKYQMASNIVKNVLAQVIAKCVAGQNISQLCRFGDQRLNEETSKQFVSKKDMKKGIAFPTTICINNIICHYAPLETDKDGPQVINDGDMVKIDLGAHLDGFAVVVGHTLVVGATGEKPCEGRKADVVVAANKALECALRMMRPGNKNMDITDTINRVCAEYECQPIKGIQSHATLQFEYDTEKSIVLNPTEEQRKKVETCVLEPFEVWILDIVVSTGDGKARENSSRPNLFKRNESGYQLKLTAARQLFAECNNRFATFPFHISALEDQNKSRFALMECSKHGNIEALDVFEEKEGEFVAQFKTTIVVTEQGPIRLSGQFDQKPYKTEFKIKDKTLTSLLSQSLKLKQPAESK